MFKSLLVNLRFITMLAFLMAGNAGLSMAMEAEEIQIQSYAKTPDVISAMKDFDAALDKVLTENGVTDASAMRTKLKDGYYTTQFGAEYKTKNGGKEAPIEVAIKTLSDTAIALQNYYIEDNANPLGSKHKLDQGADKSAYSVAHGKYHPGLRSFLEAQGHYDIFLFRLDGQNIYTVFKELDFIRGAFDETLKDTNLAEVVKAVADSTDPSFTILVDMKPYVYSYNAPARFVAAPIYDGDKKIGVLVFQLAPGM